MKREWLAFLSAVQFLTRLPVPDPGWEDGRLDRAAKWFPLVGALVGGLCGAVLWLSVTLNLDDVGILLAIGAGVLITGALHEDGLADTADGLGGGNTVERRLAIMKDSRIGAYGALALIFVILLRAFLYREAIPTGHFPLAGVLGVAMLFVGAHAASRAAMLLIIWSVPYARGEDSAKVAPIVDPPNRIGVAIALLTVAMSLIAVGLAYGLGPAMVALLVTFVVALGLRRMFIAKLGGWTGDTAGSTQVICEIAFLLGLAPWT